jgi:hypothetical protein
MYLQPPPSLIELLRSTLQQVEQSAEVSPNDSSLQKLKSSIVRTIADLEIQKSTPPRVD